ncbi:peroxidase-like isoform X2 [Anthonomus grandis grandis]|nr:peroxidase-like isoform X2 [Anthonomus grandis grandis]XP_050296414.1 peroxidase-like isoform X2 [Anthonomus grandis grandis]
MKVESAKIAIPLLGVLLWVLSIHAGIFSDAGTLYLRLPFHGGPINKNAISSTANKPEVLNILNKITVGDLNDTVNFAENVIRFLKRLENNLLWSNIKVSDGTPSHGMLISFGPDKEALDRGKEALIALRATSQLMNTYCGKLSKASGHTMSSQECSKLLSRFSFHGTPLEGACIALESPCEKGQYQSDYRSINGSCNNLNKGHRGESFTGYSRLLYADYSDGVHELRRSVTKKPLPNARTIVSSLIKTDNKPSKKATLALLQWSQFLEHDLCRSATAVAIHTDSPIECCSQEGDNLSPRFMHPLCSPIYVYDDKKYAQEGVSCLSFVRSLPATRADCSFGPADQVNQATHYLDGSQIYGSTHRRSKQLRSFNGGKLATSQSESREYLPLSRDPTRDCQLFSANSTCFESGDARVNFQPQLALMHTIWYREHNRIADELSKLNSHWDDEKIFQETRRIVIAEMQKITYGEWMEMALGKTAQEHILATSYNSKTDSSVSNAFATSVMRSLKSLSDGMPKLYDEDRTVNESIFMRNYFHNPGLLRHRGVLDALTVGLATQPSQQLDIFYADDLINKLYTNGKFGFDVLSFDLQRGRDHGLPSYMKFRQLCGLKAANGFSDFLDDMTEEDVLALQQVYSNAQDVDLTIGGLLEKPKEHSIFGPTFYCIVADQMLRTRQGDRYFYDNYAQPKPFTRNQLKEIEKITLARILCDNTDNVKHMQKRVFEKVSTSNPLFECQSEASIPKLNLNHWQEDESNSVVSF